jgi:hypothetical protein
VPNVPYRPAIASPVAEQTCDLNLGKRVVSPPPAWVVYCFLKIHQ